jgi:hypothetical protein
MAGGQKINDRGSWAGSASKESPLPMGSKMKQYNSAEGAGAEMDYEDTSEKIKSQQVEGVSKAKARPQKPLYRN